MQPDEADAAHLWDMLQAGQEALTFLQNASLERFLSDPQLRRAVERDLEIVGEAARRVSPEFQAAHPEIPWRDIIGQRNILAHDYGRVIPERIWEVVSGHLKGLIDQLQGLIPPTDE